MVQLLLFGLIAVAVIVGWRVVKREMTRVEDKLKKTDEKDAGKPGIETLEPDQDGIYRPKK